MPTVRTAPQSLAIAALLAAAQPLAGCRARPTMARSRSGFYVGGHVGYMFGNANATLGDPIGSRPRPAAPPLRRAARRRAGGLRAFFPSRLMLGIELDAPSPTTRRPAGPVLPRHRHRDGQRRARVAGEPARPHRLRHGRLDALRHRRHRLGQHALLAQSTSRPATRTPTPATSALGYVLGGGVDYRLDARWSARVEYLYTNFGLAGFAFASAPARYDSQYDLHRFRVGLNYNSARSDESKEKKKRSRPRHLRSPRPDRLRLPGLSAVQRAPMTARKACRPAARAARPGRCRPPSACACGRAASSTTTPSCCRATASPRRTAPAASPTARRSATFPTRATARRACSCARPSGWAASARRSRATTGQLAGERDVSRVTIQAGRYAVQDIFDNNAYANDPRFDFLNWSIWAAGAFDYAADSVGYTWGVGDRAEPAELGGEARLLPGARPDRHQRLRHRPVLARRLCRRDGVALPALRPARRGAPRRLVQPRLRRLLQRRRGARQHQSRPDRQRHHPADPPGPHQVRLLRQPGAGAQRQRRRLRALQLERRPHRDHVLHRHRHQPVGRPVDQGHARGAGRTTRSASPAR